MRDAIGCSFVLVIIVFFIVLVSAYLAFNVNYMKAFRMKDKIISYYEEYNGECKSECSNKIKSYADSIGYAPDSFKCSNDLKMDAKGLYCFKQFSRQNNVADADDVYSDNKQAYYYKIETKINIEIPIVDNLLGIKAFKISGDTKTFQSKY